jgi:hypothetical protein
MKQRHTQQREAKQDEIDRDAEEIKRLNHANYHEPEASDQYQMAKGSMRQATLRIDAVKGNSFDRGLTGLTRARLLPQCRPASRNDPHGNTAHGLRGE